MRVVRLVALAVIALAGLKWAHHGRWAPDAQDLERDFELQTCPFGL
jgi:hypothetical protein